MATPEELFEQALRSGGGAATPGQRVYIGNAFTDPDRDSRSSLMGGGAEKSRPRSVASYDPNTDATKARWYQMSDGERAALGIRMYRAGLIGNPADYDAAQKAWNYAVEQSAGYTAVGKNVSPWGFIDMMEASGAGNSRGSGPKNTTATSTRINIPSKADAEAVVKDIFNGAMGRDPDQGELDRYASVLIGKAKASPEKTTTRTTYNADGTQSNSMSTTTGGIGAAAMQQAVLDKAKADPEYGAYQAATTYFNALMGAIQAPA